MTDTDLIWECKGERYTLLPKQGFKNTRDKGGRRVYLFFILNLMNE